MQKTHANQFKLPSLNTLVAFEAAARRASLTLAAEELCVTPGAASRQVKALEEALGVELFRRRHNAIELTDAGRAFLIHVNAALNLIRVGAREISPKQFKLTIQAPITLTQRWLIPRIDTFRRSHPDIDLRIRSIHTASNTADIEIGYSRGSASEEEGAVFLTDRTIPVCIPRLLANTTLPVTPAEVLRLPVLLDTIDGWAWQRWCEAAGLPFRPSGGSIAFDTDEAAIDACLSGLGVAQANEAFVERLLQTGELINLFPSVYAAVGNYTAVIRATGKTVQAFIA